MTYVAELSPPFKTPAPLPARRFPIEGNPHCIEGHMVPMGTCRQNHRVRVVYRFVADPWYRGVPLPTEVRT